MANPFFHFKQFSIYQDRAAMKLTTDACIFGAWVAEQLRSSQQAGSPRVLDIGTGTGLLALMLAQQSAARIDAIEIDADTADQAQHNIADSPWGERIQLFTGDVRDYPLSSQYDAIISNPPFYEGELRSPDEQKNKARHDQGLLLAKLLEIIQRNLKTGGRFYLLLPAKRSKEIPTLLRNQGLVTTHLVTVRHRPQGEPFRLLLEGRHEQDQASDETDISEIVIWKEGQEYSERFRDLLKEYYLHL